MGGENARAPNSTKYRSTVLTCAAIWLMIRQCLKLWVSETSSSVEAQAIQHRQPQRLGPNGLVNVGSRDSLQLVQRPVTRKRRAGARPRMLRTCRVRPGALSVSEACAAGNADARFGLSRCCGLRGVGMLWHASSPLQLATTASASVSASVRRCRLPAARSRRPGPVPLRGCACPWRSVRLRGRSRHRTGCGQGPARRGRR